MPSNKPSREESKFRTGGPSVISLGVPCLPHFHPGEALMHILNAGSGDSDVLVLATGDGNLEGQKANTVSWRCWNVAKVVWELNWWTGSWLNEFSVSMGFKLFTTWDSQALDVLSFNKTSNKRKTSGQLNSLCNLSLCIYTIYLYIYIFIHIVCFDLIRQEQCVTSVFAVRNL